MKLIRLTDEQWGTMRVIMSGRVTQAYNQYSREHYEAIHEAIRDATGEKTVKVWVTRDAGEEGWHNLWLDEPVRARSGMYALNDVEESDYDPMSMKHNPFGLDLEPGTCVEIELTARMVNRG